MQVLLRSWAILFHLLVLPASLPALPALRPANASQQPCTSAASVPPLRQVAASLPLLLEPTPAQPWPICIIGGRSLFGAWDSALSAGSFGQSIVHFLAHFCSCLPMPAHRPPTCPQKWPQYVPCDCQGACKADCPCTADANFCEKFCACDPAKCGNRFPGCTCKCGATVREPPYSCCC